MPTRDDAALFLCLDTSTPTARVAVIDGGGAARFTAQETAARHSTHVLALCARALGEVGIAPAGLAGIACGGGPGSFTGLRVGLAVAKGLALPTGVPLYLVSSLEAMALDLLAAFGPEITAVPCLDAGKGEVYVAAYAANAADAQPLLREVKASCRLVPADVAPWLAELQRPVVAGSGRDRHPATLAIGPDVSSVSGPSALSVGKLALLQQARGEAADLERAVPFYGRPPDITIPVKK